MLENSFIHINTKSSFVKLTHASLSLCLSFVLSQVNSPRTALSSASMCPASCSLLSVHSRLTTLHRRISSSRRRSRQQVLQLALAAAAAAEVEAALLAPAVGHPVRQTQPQLLPTSKRRCRSQSQQMQLTSTLPNLLSICAFY